MISSSLQPFKPFEPALRLAGVLPGDVAADVIFFLADELLLGVVFFGLALLVHGALEQVGGIIAVIGVKAGGHFPDGIRHLVEEVAVVRDGHHRAFPVAQVFLQPFDRADIQMVGRLIQEEQVGFGKEQLGQQGAGALPPGELTARGGARRGG